MWGEVQGANPAASTWHSKVEPDSVDVNSNLGVASGVGPDGPEVMVVLGRVVSTVKVRFAGVASTLPARSVARTSKVWTPSASVPVVRGEAQALNAALSTRHSKVEPASEVVNAKVGVGSGVGFDGPELMVVFGATRSSNS